MADTERILAILGISASIAMAYVIGERVIARLFNPRPWTAVGVGVWLAFVVVVILCAVAAAFLAVLIAGWS